MKYLKGQIHLHTNKSDGTVAPQEVADIYKKMGYDFIVITDHRVNYDPYEFIKRDKDFLCIPGTESDTGAYGNQTGALSCLHFNGLCFQNEYVAPKNDMNNISGSINLFIESLYNAGALPQLNHPNWNWPNPYSVDYKELLDVKYPFLFEVKNCCAKNSSEGNVAWESTEFTWDTLLTAGKNVLATFSDDAHHYGVEVRNMPESFHIPGNSAIFVKGELESESIRNGIKYGNFYCSTGLEFEKYEVSDTGIYVKLKDTGREKTDLDADMKYTIIFKGRMGRPLAWVYGLEGEYKFTGVADEEYVRVKAITSNFDCAMTQPVFRDGHKIVLEI